MLPSVGYTLPRRNAAHSSGSPSSPFHPQNFIKILLPRLFPPSPTMLRLTSTYFMMSIFIVSMSQHLCMKAPLEVVSSHRFELVIGESHCASSMQDCKHNFLLISPSEIIDCRPRPAECDKEVGQAFSPPQLLQVMPSHCPGPSVVLVLLQVDISCVSRPLSL